MYRETFAPNILLTAIAYRAGVLKDGVAIKHQERQTGTVSIIQWGLVRACMQAFKELVTFTWKTPRELTYIQVSSPGYYKQAS